MQVYIAPAQPSIDHSAVDYSVIYSGINRVTV